MRKKNIMKANNKITKQINSINNNSLLVQFIKYCLVGGIATIFDWGTYSITLFLFNINYQICTIAGFILGLIVNFMLSKKMVFKEKSKVGKYEFIMYVVIGVIGLLFTTGLMYIFVEKLIFNPLVSRMLTTVLVLIWNFVGRKLLY